MPADKIQIRPDGYAAVNADGAPLLGADGDPCCCGDDGNGDQGHWIYLRKYCTENDCDGWIKVWSLTDWGDGRTWGRAFRIPDGFACPVVYKLNGVCFVAYCPHDGGVEINCSDEGIATYDGPGTGIVWYHWRDRMAACGPCCGPIRCVPRVRWVCDGAGGGHWHCSNLGREYKLNTRASGTRTVKLTPAYLAALRADHPLQCEAELLQTQRCNTVEDKDAYLKLISNGCYELTGRCNRSHYDYYQSYFRGYPTCDYATTSDSLEDVWCTAGTDTQIPDMNFTALGMTATCGYDMNTDNTDFLHDANGCPIASGTHRSSLGGSSYADTDWTFYEDDFVSHFIVHHVEHSFCVPPGGGEMECFITEYNSEVIGQLTVLQACTSEDDSECGPAVANRLPPVGGSALRRHYPGSDGLSVIRQTADQSFGREGIARPAVRRVTQAELVNVSLESLL